MHSNLKYKYGNRKFWAEGYYVVSTVGLNESIIRKYIREQESHDIAIDRLITKEYTNPFGNNVNVNIKMYKSDKIKMYNYSKLTWFFSR